MFFSGAQVSAAQKSYKLSRGVRTCPAGVLQTWKDTDHRSCKSRLVRNTVFFVPNAPAVFLRESQDIYSLQYCLPPKGNRACLLRRLLRGELPHGFVIFIAVFFWSHTGKVLERLDKVALRRKGKVIGNVYDGLVRVAQEMRCLFYFFFADIVTDGNAEVLLEYPGEIALG